MIAQLEHKRRPEFTSAIRVSYQHRRSLLAGGVMKVPDGHSGCQGQRRRAAGSGDGRVRFCSDRTVVRAALGYPAMWLADLLKELRRRHVFRMTAIYIISSWVVIQVASEALPALNLDERAIR